MTGLHLETSSGRRAELFDKQRDMDHYVAESLHENELEIEQLASRQPMNTILNHLRNLTAFSLVGYEEIADVAQNARLESFAIVVLRQRCPRLRALTARMTENSPIERNSKAESRLLLRAKWRLAILSLQKRDYAAFSENAQAAEAHLEGAYLAAAKFIVDQELAEVLRDDALMIYGARTVIQEIVDDSNSGEKRQN
jgi:hypothetical protein